LSAQEIAELAVAALQYDRETYIATEWRLWRNCVFDSGISCTGI